MSALSKRLEKIYKKTTAQEKELFKKAAEEIKNGNLVAFPTETVYGLGANALNSEAVEKIYKAKGRPSDNPLILHVSSLEMVEKLVHINDNAKKLMEHFWPGPLSVVLESKDIIPTITKGGLNTAAVRMPNNRIALELIKESDLPIAAPSANTSGRPSPTDAKTVKNDLGENVKIILDGGETDLGLESTVIDMTGENPILLRPGGISEEEIEKVLSLKVKRPMDKNTIKRSPGTRYRHYAPKLPLVISDCYETLNKAEGKRWAWLGLNEPTGKPNIKIIFKTIEEYAHELFRILRDIEKLDIDIIIAEVPPKEGIGEAVADRLRRAAGN
ncbi:MAG: L-threonylcarbamoyladenylate synthase [Synergistaceae bacterium]